MEISPIFARYFGARRRLRFRYIRTVCSILLSSSDRRKLNCIHTEQWEEQRFTSIEEKLDLQWRGNPHQRWTGRIISNNKLLKTSKQHPWTQTQTSLPQEDIRKRDPTGTCLAVQVSQIGTAPQQHLGSPRSGLTNKDADSLNTTVVSQFGPRTPAGQRAELVLSLIHI